MSYRSVQLRVNPLAPEMTTHVKQAIKELQTHTLLNLHNIHVTYIRTCT